MPKLLVAHQLVSLAQLLVFTLVRSTPALFASFGFAAGEQPALAGFLLFQNIIGPLDEVGGWVVGAAVEICVAFVLRLQNGEVKGPGAAGLQWSAQMQLPTAAAANCACCLLCCAVLCRVQCIPTSCTAPTTTATRRWWSAWRPLTPA